METEEKLKKRIAYEKMLAGISERAVSVDDIDEFLDESLRRMGSILDVSRIFIFTYHPASDTFACICEWVAAGITTLADLDELKITIPWGTRYLKDGKTINFENTRDNYKTYWYRQIMHNDPKNCYAKYYPSILI